MITKNNQSTVDALKAIELKREDIKYIINSWCQIISPTNYVDWSTGDRSVCLDEALDNRFLNKHINLDPDYANNRFNMASIKLATQGDYCGSLVEKANIRYLEKTYIDKGLPGIYATHLRYNTTSIYIDLRILNDDQATYYYETYRQLRDDLRGLVEYSLFDDHLLSEIEEEAKHENWDNWIEQDFLRELETSFEPSREDCEIFEDLVASVGLKDFYFGLEDGSNFIWVNDHSDQYSMDIEQIIDHLSDSPDVLKSIGLEKK